jgi:Tfp pilus assembly protein PilF
MEALRLDPGSPGIHHELAQMFLQQNQVEDGLKHFEASARAAPWDPAILCEYGTLLANLRRFDEARHYLQRALWIRPDFPQARENLRAVEQLSSQKK